MTNKLEHDLIWAVEINDIKSATELLKQKGININFIDKTGVSALSWAIYRKNPEMVELLLEQPNLNINIKDNGKTPFELAVSRGDIEITKLLRNYIFCQICR